MSELLTGKQLTVGHSYFLVGYLDQQLSVPFIRSLIYLREHASGNCSGGNVTEHVFVNAVAWFKAEQKENISVEEMVWITENELDCVKSVRGLIDELREQCLAT